MQAQLANLRQSNLKFMLALLTLGNLSEACKHNQQTLGKLFADDLNLLSKCARALQDMLQWLRNEKERKCKPKNEWLRLQCGYNV